MGEEGEGLSRESDGGGEKDGELGRRYSCPLWDTRHMGKRDTFLKSY